MIYLKYHIGTDIVAENDRRGYIKKEKLQFDNLKVVEFNAGEGLKKSHFGGPKNKIVLIQNEVVEKLSDTWTITERRSDAVDKVWSSS